jgi:hypothetical protein
MVIGRCMDVEGFVDLEDIAQWEPDRRRRAAGAPP